MNLIAVLWGAAALGAAAVAAKRRALAPLPFAVAAAMACVLAVLGEGLVVSVFIFAVVFVLGRWVIRPALRSRDVGELRAKSGAGSMIGRPGLVVERIANTEAVGCVRIDDEIWNARTWEDGIVLQPGARVHVVEVRGATAVVSP